MAGIKLVTDAKPDTVLQLAWRAAQDLGFKLTPIENGAFTASKGHFVLSMLVGPAAPHCSFKISANAYPDGTTDVVLERNYAGASGLIGRRHINREAATVMDNAAEAIQKNGGKVIERKEI
jgi:hypothetical protein